MQNWSQSLSGWDGVFHGLGWLRENPQCRLCRNPFQGGMGFFTKDVNRKACFVGSVAIPFRVGWGFSRKDLGRLGIPNGEESQSLSGWDGVFHYAVTYTFEVDGWCRNPFQGGMGFFTNRFVTIAVVSPKPPSQSLSGWDGVFH